MKRDFCREVRAASANRMHSAALLRSWSKLGKCASISVHMGTDRALCLKNDASIQVQKMPARTASQPKSFERLSVMSHCTLGLTQPVPDHQVPTTKTEYYWSKYRK
jgi:hypothetical protein